MAKSKSSITGRYATAKAAKAKPKTHYVSDDYPARVLRKLVRMWEGGSYVTIKSDPKYGSQHIDKLIASIKRRMGWR